MIRRTVAKNVSEQQALDACSPERQVAGSADSVRLSGGAPRMARGTRQVRKSREPGGRTGCQSGNKRKRVAANATTLVLQNWCRGRDSNPHSYCHYPLKIACLPVPPPRRQKALYAKLRRLASLFSELFPFRLCLFRLCAGVAGDGTWSIFSLKCFSHFKPYGLPFRGKSVAFPLTLGRAALDASRFTSFNVERLYGRGIFSSVQNGGSMPSPVQARNS